MRLMTGLAMVALTTTITGCAYVNELINPAWDRSYGGADKIYDTALLNERDALAAKFQTLAFTDPVNGNVMAYNLFVPANYDANKTYPLIVFMGDGSTTGKGAMAPLKQGWGGIIWATEAEQAKHESFVLVPAFDGPANVVNDDWEVSDEVDTAMRLLEKVTAEYRIDTSRIYTTGQSMGGMISFYWNATHPDLFAASLFVGSQWDINVLSPLRDAKFAYVTSAGDLKASGGMNEIRDDFNAQGIEYGHALFPAKWPQAAQDQAAEDLLEQGFSQNFIQFEANTVAPDGKSGGGSEHMYSFDYAYQLEPVRDWLFEQSK